MENTKRDGRRLIHMIRNSPTERNRSTPLLNSVAIVGIFILGGFYLALSGHMTGTALSLTVSIAMTALLYRDYKNRFGKWVS